MRSRLAARAGLWIGATGFGVLLITGVVFAATPVADGKVIQTNQGVAKTITLTGTDDAGALDYVATSPSHGSLDNPTGTMTCGAGTPATCTANVLYTPDAGQWTDSFTYTVTNPTDGTSAPATVTIIVDAPPVAVDDPASTCSTSVTNIPYKYIAVEDNILTVAAGAACGLLDNDTDADADSLTAAKATDPAHGSVTVTSSGGFTYTANPNYFGLDSFTYTVSDGLLTDTGTVSLTVLPNDDPPNAVNNTTFVVPENAPATALAVLANDTYLPDAPETLRIVSVTQGAHGAVVITGGGTGLTYKPAALFVGTDSFTYTIKDSGSTIASDTATVALTVAKDVTPPVVAAPTQQIRTALSTTATTFAIHIAWSGTDAGVGISRFELQAQVDGGTWTSQALATPTTTSVNPFVTVGHVYRYRVRGIDRNGNVGPWRYSQYLTVSRYEETHALITYAGTWVKSPLNASNSGGYTKYAFGIKSATFTVTARDFAFVSPTSSTRGTARIYVDGVLVSTISEKSTATVYRRVLWATHFSTLSSHTIKVVMVGDGRIDVDCFLALR